MADKLMLIPNDDTQNYAFCRSQLIIEMFRQLNEETNQSFEKSLKLFSQKIRKH